MGGESRLRAPLQCSHPSPQGSPPAGQILRPEGRMVSRPAPAASAAHGLDRGSPGGQAAQRASRHSAEPRGAEASEGAGPQGTRLCKAGGRTGHSLVSRTKSSPSQRTDEKDAAHAGACPEEAGVRGQAAAGGGSHGPALSGQARSPALLSGGSCSAASVDGAAGERWRGWGRGHFRSGCHRAAQREPQGQAAQNRVRCLRSADSGSGQSERQEEGGPGEVTAGPGGGCGREPSPPHTHTHGPSALGGSHPPSCPLLHLLPSQESLRLGSQRSGRL